MLVKSLFMIIMEAYFMTLSFKTYLAFYDYYGRVYNHSFILLLLLYQNIYKKK